MLVRKSFFFCFLLFPFELSMSFVLFHFTGFVTPRNKNVLSQKALFLDKPKMAFGDLKKNSLNVVTPLRNGTVEKTKQFQLLTPTFKSMKINDASVSTPTFERMTINNAAKPQQSTPKPQRNPIDYTKDNFDVWNQKMVLSDDQFDLLFINSPPPMAPPSPSPSPSPEREYPDYVPFDFDYKPSWDDSRKPQNDDDELPPLNFDYFGENFCGTPLKENDINAVNRFNIF